MAAFVMLRDMWQTESPKGPAVVDIILHDLYHATRVPGFGI